MNREKELAELRAIVAAQSKLITKLQGRLTFGLYSHFTERVLKAIPFNSSIGTDELMMIFENDASPRLRQKIRRSLRRLKEKHLVIRTGLHLGSGSWRRVVNEV